MTRHSSSLPSVPYLSLILILINLLLVGCGLFEPFSPPAEPAMSVEEALEIEPLDSRPTVMEEMGPPDAFTIQFKELEGEIVRWETWSYFDFTTQFDFIDGELIWTIDIEPVPDGSIYAHFYDPLELQEGMSQADVQALYPDMYRRISAYRLSPSLFSSYFPIHPESKCSSKHCPNQQVSEYIPDVYLSVPTENRVLHPNRCPASLKLQIWHPRILLWISQYPCLQF